MAQNITYPPSEGPPTAESVQSLRRKLATSRTVSRALLEEQNRNEALIQQLRRVVGNTQPSANGFSFLTSGTSAQALKVTQTPGQQSLTTNTTFAVSQLPALRSLLADLRPKLAALKDTNMGVGMDSAKDEVREERRGYIEQRTLAHLDRNGQKVADDAILVSGKRVDSGEVQALEKVASMFDPT